MATQGVKTTKTIDRFLKETGKQFFVKKVILFGSYAKGHAKKYSDIDIAVVSDDFKNINYFERLVKLGIIAWQVKATEIEALGFTVDEYNHASNLDFLGEIKKKGKIIYKG